MYSGVIAYANNYSQSAIVEGTGRRQKPLLQNVPSKYLEWILWSYQLHQRGIDILRPVYQMPDGLLCSGPED